MRYEQGARNARRECRSSAFRAADATEHCHRNGTHFDAAIEKQAALHRNKKKREKYLLERAASYEAFLEERRNLLAATKPRAPPIRSESPSPPQKTKPVATKKKKKKPRWALLYEDAVRRITAVKAFEDKK